MTKAKDFINGLVKEGDTLKELSRTASSGSDLAVTEEYYQRRIRWIRNCYDVLNYNGLDEYWKHISRIAQVDMNSFLYSNEIAKIIGIMQSAIDAIDHGYLGKIKYILHADMFDSYLDQAAELLLNGHKIPSAVLGRIVIEKWIRDQAEKAGISNWETDKASNLNDQLKKAGILSLPKWRQIQTYLDIGNKAAHGDESAFKDSDVKQMIDFSKVNCV
jgi:hypothetical protein